MLTRSMPGPWTPRIRSSSGLISLVLLGPLLVPAALLPLRLLAASVRNEAAPAASWQLLTVVGPAIPLYVLLLPLLPFLVRQLRRGWAPPFSRVLGAALLASLLIDAVFYLARRSPG